MQEIHVSDLNAVGPALRQLAKKSIEVGYEIAAMRVVIQPKVRELEHQQADIGPDVLARPQERRGEQVGVQKVFIGLARPISEGDPDSETS